MVLWGPNGMSALMKSETLVPVTVNPATAAGTAIKASPTTRSVNVEAFSITSQMITGIIGSKRVF